MEILKDIQQVFLSLTEKFSDNQAFFGFLFLALLLAFYKQIPAAFKYVFDYIKGRKESKKPEIKTHDIFFLFEDLIVELEDTRVLGNAYVKTVMYHSAVKEFFKAIKTEIEKLVNDEETMKIDSNLLHNKVSHSLTSITKNFNESYKEKLRSHGLDNKDINFIMSYFTENRLKNLNLAGLRTNKIFISKFHQTNFDKVVAVLDLIAYTALQIPPTFRDAFEEMNGRFDTYDWDSNANRYYKKTK